MCFLDDCGGDDESQGMLLLLLLFFALCNLVDTVGGLYSVEGERLLRAKTKTLSRAKIKTLSRLKTITVSLVWRENRIINGKRRCVCVWCRGGGWGVVVVEMETLTISSENSYSRLP